MSRSPAFVLPEGVVFIVQPDGVTVENRGDIVLHSAFGGVPMLVRSLEGDVELHAGLAGGRVEAAGSVRIVGDATAERIAAGGDVRISGSASVSRLDAGGDVEIGAHASVESLTAGGTVAIAGDLTTTSLRGRSVALAGAALQARSVAAAERIVVRAVKITADAVIAPHVEIDPRATGRVSVLECQNEIGPKALKGCLSLADWADMFGDPEAWLKERGIELAGGAVSLPAAPSAPLPSPLPAAPEVASVPVPESHAVVEATTVMPRVTAPVAIDVPTPEPQAEVAVETAAPAAQPVVAEAPAAHVAHEEIEVIDEAPAIATVDARALEQAGAEETWTGKVLDMDAIRAAEPEAAPAKASDDTHAQMMQAVMQLVQAYGGNEVPPAVDTLSTLIALRDYPTVKSRITQMYQEMSTFHRERGMRIPAAVTAAFNQINALVRKA